MLARRVVVFAALSLLLFIAGFFMTILHAIMCIIGPLSLTFCAKYRLDALQEGLQYGASAGRSVQAREIQVAAAKITAPLKRAA